MARDELYELMAEQSKAKFDADRQRFLAKAVSDDDGGWKKHTEFHWSRMLAGHKLDYWPSRKKWQYQGKVSRGEVAEFIAGKEQADAS